MPIKAKDIPNFLGEEKEIPKHWEDRKCGMVSEYIGYNQHRQEIAQKPLGLDERKVTKVLKLIDKYTYTKEVKHINYNEIHSYSDYYLCIRGDIKKLIKALAQALIDKEHLLIVVKE